MRNVYIDIGCFDGDSIIKFLANNPEKKWEVFGFDPNPNFTELWVNLADGLTVNNIQEISMSRAAAWINNDPVSFTVRPPEAPYGSTIMKNKNDWGQGQIIQVEAFDFSEWLKENFTEEDYVVVKCDCEGAEYDILDKLIADGNQNLVDFLFVEFHDKKLKGEDYSLRRLNILKNLTIPWREWVWSYQFSSPLLIRSKDKTHFMKHLIVTMI